MAWDFAGERRETVLAVAKKRPGPIKEPDRLATLRERLLLLLGGLFVGGRLVGLLRVGLRLLRVGRSRVLRIIAGRLIRHSNSLH